jgi:aldehyde dehydrogenase (NAD+)
MPLRGQIVRELGDAFRARKRELGRLVTLEVGKIQSEAEGEIQEIVDICDHACGLSRTIGGHTWASERPNHRLHERWHPLGPVLCITAFNFPAAVWGWNAALALVCGDPVVWKPSLKAPLTAMACHEVARAVRVREAALGLVAVPGAGLQFEQVVAEVQVDGDALALRPVSVGVDQHPCLRHGGGLGGR